MTFYEKIQLDILLFFCRYLITFAIIQINPMKHKLLLFFLFFSFLMQGQCFDCAKVYAGWIGGRVYDLEKTNTAVYVTIATHLSGANTTDRSGLYKYDLNCNLIWKKEFPDYTGADYFTVDDQGNSYVLVNETLGGNYNNGIEPYRLDGLDFYFGVTLYKISSSGNVVWNRKIGVTRTLAKNVFYNNGHVYVTGAFNNSININNQILLSDNAYYGRAFVAKFDVAGNLIDAKKYGTNNDIFMTSEADKSGNIYFAKADPNFTYSSIFKVNSNLDVVWQKEISNNGNVTNKTSYRPTILHYNPINDKLYLWGCFDRTVNILGTDFTTNSPNNGVLQSILTEFNTSNGNLEHYKQFNNNSQLEYPWEANNRSASLNKSFMTEKGNELFILSSFSGIMKFPNKIIESRTFNGGGNTYYYNEELVLFKVDLNSFEPEYILKSSGSSHFSNGLSLDAAGPIQFDGDNLFLTSNFQSEPLTINNSVIYGNSGNNESNGLLYKLKFNSSVSGEIIAEKTCFNTPTDFLVRGTFDSILWDFDDPNSTTNNSATISNPQHQFTAIGTYNVSAVIKCGTETQTLKKEIVITNIPKSFTLDPITACETTSGTGISNLFDTSNINEKIINNQTNLVVEYRDSNGNLLQTPLPNPYTNTVKNEETIKVKSYFANNPSCFAEADLKLQTITKPANLLINSPQNFCIQQNATLDNIAITGQNIKWYDVAAAGTLLPNTTLLQNNTTYYASQSINGCESERVPVKINIQNTPPPTGDANQPFCSGSNPTIASIMVTGDLVEWYDTASNGTLLPTTTNLQDGKTYYVSQTVNNCESQRFAVTVSVKDTPLAPLELNSRDFCKSENATLNDIQIDGQNLKWYSSNIAASTLPNTTLLENNTTYYVSQTTGCESERTPILVKVNDINLPTAKAEQPFCIDQNATIADINIQGTEIIWYDAATTGNILAETTLLENKTYYATQTVNTCESKRVAVSIKIQDTQNPIANSPQTFCIQKNAKISDIEINGENIKWFESLSSNTTLSETTLLQNGITYYASQTINNCESDRIPVTIKVLEAISRDCINFVDELPFPKFFTPNNDTYNDYWTIDFAYLAPNTGIKIFDRYGKLIKELVSNGTWDGTFLGQELPASDYWFTVTRLNGTEYRGHFSLKR